MNTYAYETRVQKLEGKRALLETWERYSDRFEAYTGNDLVTFDAGYIKDLRAKVKRLARTIKVI